MDFDIFPDLRSPIIKVVNDGVDNLITNYGDFFDSLSGAILSVLLLVEQTLRAVPPSIMIVAIAALTFFASYRKVLTLGVIFGLWLIGSFGMWDQAMQTLAIVLVSVIFSVILGLPFGILSASSNRARVIISAVLDLMQTIPSFVYLLPVAMLFGLGKVPAIMAIVIYSVPPLIRLTDLGIREVDAAVVEASSAFGATRWQILCGVQFPLSLPSIMQGINQTTMMALSMVVIASMIGARGVGETVLKSFMNNDFGMGVIGGITITILAVIMDRIIQAYGARFQQHRQKGA